jgi:TolA-binding protein
MRFHVVATILLAGCAVPALAQGQPAEKRIGKLEQEMRAVQRKVFPSGAGAIVEPEIPAAAAQVQSMGVPAGSAVSDLTARVDALEAQLAALTGQIEQSGFRVRQVEEAFNRFRTDAEARFASMQKPAPAEQQLAAAEPVQSASAEQAPAEETLQREPAVASADAGEEAYNRGFRLWERKDFAGAQASLEAMAKKYPSHPKASWARNLAGRAYLDEGKAATAAKLLLGNYQTDPKGERAADSLLFLGEACRSLPGL